MKQFEYLAIGLVLSVMGLVSPINRVEFEAVEEAYEIESKPRAIVLIVDLPNLDPTNTYEYIVAERQANREMRSAIYSAINVSADMPILQANRTYSPDEIECLAKNIYFEARSESLQGHAAVALVTINRLNSKRYPDDICDVSRDGGEVVLHKCQFSWYCDGMSDNPHNQVAYERSLRVAKAIIEEGVAIPDFTHGATHYHADYVSPYWAPYMVRTVQIDKHIYYREEVRNREILASL